MRQINIFFIKKVSLLNDCDGLSQTMRQKKYINKNKIETLSLSCSRAKMMENIIRIIQRIRNPFELIYLYLTAENDINNNDHQIKRIYMTLFKLILFNIYLAYWIPTRTTYFCVMVLETLVINTIIHPVLSLWFRWNRIYNPREILDTQRTVENFIRKLVYRLISLFLLFYATYYIIYNHSTYFPSDDLEQINNQTSIIEGYQRTWFDIQQEKQALDIRIKQLQTDFKQHKAHTTANQTAIWIDLQKKQIQIDALQKSLGDQVQNTIKKTQTASDNTLKDKNNVSLDNLSRLITDILNAQKTENMIQTALQTYHQDVLNKADFASMFRHARIIYGLTSYTYSHYPIWQQLILRFFAHSPSENSPYEAISPGTHIGECWSMYGSYGTLGIKLSEPIIIQSISIDYPSFQMMAGDMSTAPRKVELFGIRKSLNVSLGTAEYDIHDEHAIQTFDMNFTIENKPRVAYDIVQLHIQSNWGHPNWTDIYRIRIHGIPSSMIKEDA